ncbi:MAG: aldehyde ferredoxin oxidoreductase family protein [Polyangia bacterium]|jgi:aldehyde:ferredoxin oxidoreductase|nr:aldehyde ferredoxin oxidoreductase family protein [Polyangia bacterium]
MPGGHMNCVLYVDLTTRSVERKTPDPEDLRLYVGGRGLGIRLLYDLTEPGMDPYDERMPLIFSAGPLTGTNAPQSNRFVVTTKSPLTGFLADSHSGGSFATKLRKAGYDALVIRGRAPSPVYIQIDEDRVEIKDASALWGKTTSETQAALPKTHGMAVIGPAGENKVRFACIVSQKRVAGRGGVGAVMGSKNLKAVVVNGKKEIPVADPEAYKAMRQAQTKLLQSHPATGRILPDLGTASLVLVTAGRNIIPTRNYQAGQDLRSHLLSGERMAEEFLEKKDGCMACPVRCGRHVKVNGVEGKGPEFETIGLMGHNLGIFDLASVIELGQLCDEVGVDSISMGGTLGFVTELTERNMMESPLAWGNVEAYRKAVLDTAARRGLGDSLAEGTRRLADRYGGQEFAIHVKGLDLPAYDPRGCVGQGLEYAVNNRGGCHIRGATMYLEATGPVSVDPESPKAKPELVIFQQNTNAGVSSLCMCYFSAYVVIPAIMHELDPNSLVYRGLMGVIKQAGPLLRVVLAGKAPIQVLWYENFLSAVLGRKVTMGDMAELGERVYNLERLYNLREGLTSAEDKLPDRLLHTPLSKNGQRGVPLDQMLPAYYKVRGWDSRGIPTKKTITRLGIRV